MEVLRVQLGTTTSRGTPRTSFGTVLSTLMGGSLRRTPKSECRLPLVFFLRDSPEAISCSVEPKVPFASSYNSVPGQISQGLFSRIDVPRGHTDGYIVFPWGSNLTVQSVGSLKHTWSNKPIADTISAYVRGSTFLPNLPPIPVASLNWYQTWNPSGKGSFVFSFSVAHILNTCRRDRCHAILSPARQFSRDSSV